MNNTRSAVVQYYDANAVAKVADFVNSNARVEVAYDFVKHFFNQRLSRDAKVLEVGCGIGWVTWLLKRDYPTKTFVALDPSPESIAIANALFSQSDIDYRATFLSNDLFPGQRFDCVLFMDVYEHVAQDERPSLHHAVRELLSDDGIVLMTVPTPRHLAMLRGSHPKQIQPIDEEIDVSTLLSFAEDTGTQLIYYCEKDVWHQGDYAHAVFARNRSMIEIRERSRISSLLQRVSLLISPSRWPSKRKRLKMVAARLGVTLPCLDTSRAVSRAGALTPPPSWYQPKC